MTKPDISPNFTVDDIHKIREYNWEQTRLLPVAEQTEYYRKKAQDFLDEAGIIPQERKTESKRRVM
ncbi:MAG: hypothetical protein K6E69_10730 [Treponema sp.]|uniref:hypothetical protein n=1 Tax=Treponema sp. TaxID=166 RepID=UPI00298EC921|nr:hypothetical protein [Treponema sp.]MCR5387584.1 hypothetical protein [Treponema sp.]